MKTKTVFCALAICLAASLAMAQQVSVNYNHQANFSQYHTYAWGSNNTNQIQNSILAQVAQQNIESAMASKGLQKVPESFRPACCGSIVAETYFVDARSKDKFPESQNPDLILPASGGEREQTSWNAWGMRGIAQDTLNNNGNMNQKEVQNAVNKMSKQWPKN